MSQELVDFDRLDLQAALQRLNSIQEVTHRYPLEHALALIINNYLDKNLPRHGAFFPHLTKGEEVIMGEVKEFEIARILESMGIQDRVVNSDGSPSSSVDECIDIGSAVLKYLATVDRGILEKV